MDNEVTSRPGCLFIFSWLHKLFAKKPKPEALPYRVSDKFLSPAELSFYLVLRQVLKDRAVVCVKVSLGDLFFVNVREGKVAHRNRIDRKHVDFLLCEPNTMRPLAGIELDDASHGRKDRQERDAFVDQVFAAASLPLLHQPAQRNYDVAAIATLVGPVLLSAISAAPPKTTPAQPPKDSANSNPQCPKCGTALVIRKAKQGANAGKEFWACPNYPNCRHLEPIAS